MLCIFHTERIHGEQSSGRSRKYNLVPLRLFASLKLMDKQTDILECQMTMRIAISCLLCLIVSVLYSGPLLADSASGTIGALRICKDSSSSAMVVFQVSDGKFLRLNVGNNTEINEKAGKAQYSALLLAKMNNLPVNFEYMPGTGTFCGMAAVGFVHTSNTSWLELP